MKRNRSIPPFGVIPVLVYPDVRGEQQAPQDGVATHVIRVRVDDVDSVFERARSQGARVLQTPIEYEYGERECTLEDLAGHRWQFTETVRDVAPEDYGCETVSPWPGE